MAAGNSLLFFMPPVGSPPAANWARNDRRNQHEVFDLALAEEIVFSAIMPRHYAGGGLTIYLHYAMSSAVADDIRLDTSLERVGDQQQDIDADGFAAAQNTGDITVPGTSGLVDIVTTTHTTGAQMDGILVGEGFRLKVERVAVAGSDAAGDLEIWGIEIQETP